MKVSGHIVNVVEHEIFDGEIEFSNSRILSVRRMSVPASSPYILPGFIDSHVHIESSMVVPSCFAAEAVKHGTVGAVCDPHEIANVCGLQGVRFMLDNARGLPFHFWFGAPSCVPCTDMETSGASFGCEETAEMLSWPEVHYLSEMMNFPGVIGGVPSVLEKIKCALALGKPVDGHAPGLIGKQLKKYISAGISTDHECTNVEEAEEKISLGMKVLIRDGSAAKCDSSFYDLIDKYPDSVMFCSDDLHPDDFVKGHIDKMVKRAVGYGCDVWNVLKAACFNPILHYGIGCGLLRPGDSADFIEVDSLESFNVLHTFVQGEEMVDDNASYAGVYPNFFTASPLSAGSVRLPAGLLGRIRVIEAEDMSLVTSGVIEKAAVKDGVCVSDPSRDILKIVVYNRYSPSTPSVGFIRGFGMKKGALASTIAHDSHNIVAIGTDDGSIVSAINRVISMCGGIVAVNGDEISSMPLPVAGLMSLCSVRDAAREYENMQNAAASLGCVLRCPYMTMGFMCLPVIPSLKMTDKGLFDVEKFDFTSAAF